VEQAQQGNHFGALFFIDLDGFKQVNDRLGHPAGDDLLKKVGEVLTRHTRSHDIAARMGGDEFAVLLPKIDEAYARAVAERIIRQVAAIPVPENLAVTTSAGITLISVATPDAETVLKRADVALYAAKGAGKNRTQYYEDLAAASPPEPALVAQPAH
jgi:diguanylate cyclase (GGDEF)-like protein